MEQNTLTEIPARLVAELRARTNSSMMDCKKALQATGGDLDKAVLELRKRGQASAEKKASRTAKEGVIAAALAPDLTAGVLVEVNCETDFVARNSEFIAFADQVAQKSLADPKTDFKADCVAAVGKLGENIMVRRALKFERQGPGLIGRYIHLGNKLGVLIEVGCKLEASVPGQGLRDLAKDLMHQIAAANPLVVKREQVPPAILEREKEIFSAQVKNKPANIVEKIVQGKLDKFLAGVSLLEQAFVKNTDLTIREHIAAASKAAGDEFCVRRFVRFQVGEEIAS